jgi:GNAT superfamily N-acetyltransferase
MNPTLELRRGYSPGAIGWIAELHGRYYATEWGVGAPFEILIARELCDFVERYQPDRDLLLTAHLGEVTIGSLAVFGETASPESARLRFMIVDPQFHGRGAGRALLSAALDWCRTRGFASVFLWTVDRLPASRALYDRAGFRVVESTRDDRYSTPLDNLKMELRLR